MSPSFLLFPVKQSLDLICFPGIQGATAACLALHAVSGTVTWVTTGMLSLLEERMARLCTFHLGLGGSLGEPDLRALLANSGVTDDGEKQLVCLSRKAKKERKKIRKRREGEGEEGKKVLFIEASCLGLGAGSPSSCYFMLATPLPPLAQVQLSVDFSASESTRLILYMINCQRHGWPYGTEKASSNSYFCM